MTLKVDKQETHKAERETEDQVARRDLGPRGVPGAADTAKMTLQEEQQLPKSGKFDGHTA